MALQKEIRMIGKQDIRPGQVLEIDYDGKTAAILALDPNASVVSTTNSKSGGVGQGRANKLHAIKLGNFIRQEDLIDLIKEIRSLGKEIQPSNLYNTFINSKYLEGRNYRTYSPEKIINVRQLLIGQNVPTTKKISIENGSVLYGVTHNQHVKLASADYDKFVGELSNVQYQTFYEGYESHEEVTQEILDLLIDRTVSAESWEPPKDTFDSLANIGNLVAGWWNQTIDDGQGLINLKGEWDRYGFSLTTTIGDAFKTAMGANYQIIIDNFTGYEEYGRYSKDEFLSTLDKRAFNDDGTYTDDLYDFNEAGHDQVFPEDQTPPLPPGKLKAAEVSFNRMRDEHLLNMMRTRRGIYFAGEGHVDNVRALL